MANHRQAVKRNRQRIKKQAHHRHFRTHMRTLIKRVRTALEKKDPEQAQETLKQAVPVIDRCAQKGVVAREKASRLIGRLTRATNSL